MKRTFFIGLFLLLAIIAISGYFFEKQNKRTETPIFARQDEKLTPETAPVTGTLYRDPQGVFTVLYPTDYTLDTKDEKHIRIYKIGQTQKGQTEMYDGVTLVFEVIDLDGQSLETWVDSSIKAQTKGENFEIIDPKKEIIQNAYSGFTYSVRSLGISHYTILQKDNRSEFAIQIVQTVEDPRNVGYQEETDAILKTLEILK